MPCPPRTPHLCDELVNALRRAGVEDILLAIRTIEEQGREGFRFDLCYGLYREDPLMKRTDPVSFHDSMQADSEGSLHITGHDPTRRRDAIRWLCEKKGITVMEANRRLTAGEYPDPYYWYFSNRAEAEAELAAWQAHGFTGKVYGFGRLRGVESITYTLSDLIKSGALSGQLNRRPGTE